MPRDAKQQRRRFWRFTAFVLVLMLPVFAAAFFARPSADDFGYAQRTHDVVLQGGGIWQLLTAAVETDAQFFNSWQGLYSSGFLLAFQPGIFGGKWYGLTTCFIIAMLFFCLWGCFALVGRHLAAEHRYLPAGLAVLFTYAFVQGMPNQVEGLFWFNGAANYIPFFALTVLNAGLLFHLLAGEKYPVWPAAVSAAVSVVVSGGHHVAALLDMLVLLLALLAGVRCKRFAVVLPFAAGLAGLLVNLTAPGTRVRMDGFSSASMPEAVVKSFLLTVFNLIRWLDVPLLCLLALLTPLAVALAGRLPAPGCLHLVAGPAVTFVMLWAMVWLPSYTMGGIGAGRLINVVWMTFVLGAAYSWCALVVWAAHRVDLARLLPQKHTALIGAALLVCMACIGSHTVKEGLDNHFATSLEAAYELLEGVPQRFAAAHDAREAALLEPGGENVTIRPLTDEEKPYLLYFSDVTPGPDVWGLADYYNKQSVTISDNE